MTWCRSFIAVVSLLVLAHASAARAQPPAAEAGSVTLALTEYNRLVDLAARTNSAAGAPLATAASSVLNVRVDGATARGTLTFTGTAVRPGSNRVALVSANTTLNVPPGAAATPLVTVGNVIAAVVAPGPFSVVLGWSAEAPTAAGRTTLTLPASRSGTARAIIEIPGEPSEIRVKGGTVTARRRASSGATALDVTLVPSVMAEVSWIARDEVTAAPTGPARVVSDIASVVTVTDTDIRVSAVVTLEVTRGRLPVCTLTVPDGYRVVGVHGATVDRVEPIAGAARITLLTPDAARHVLVAQLERPWPAGATTVDAVTVGVVDTHRERGDIAVESPDTTVVTETTADGADRVDVREMGTGVRALARWPLLAAYRYQRLGGSAGPRVTLHVARFADANVAPAIVSAARATTLITPDGRALTEVHVLLENERQPFMRVGLPAGGRIVSVTLDDEAAKPVTGSDGLRVPLLHAGRSGVARELRYVYLHDGTPFVRKGDVQMLLPTMDLPVGVVHWEVFVPDDIRARRVAGTALDAERFDNQRSVPWMPLGTRFARIAEQSPKIRISALQGGMAGQVRGRATEMTGGVLPGVTVMLRNGSYVARGVTNERGEYVFSGVPAGQVSLEATLTGFSAGLVTFAFDGQPVAVDVVLAISALSETVTVTGVSPRIDVSQSASPPDHVLQLQQRVAGVLPIPIDVPRAGRSMQFVAPLVVDAAPSVTLRYKRR